MELGRFKLKNGAKLRTEYINFTDMSTEYDTVNIINAPYAAYKESSISPQILRNFGKAAFTTNLVSALDTSFCMICLQNKETIERELILNYISSRLNLEMREYSNKEIYDKLNTILKSMKEGQKPFNNGLLGARKIFVD